MIALSTCVVTRRLWIGYDMVNIATITCQYLYPSIDALNDAIIRNFSDLVGVFTVILFT